MLFGPRLGRPVRSPDQPLRGLRGACGTSSCRLSSARQFQSRPHLIRRQCASLLRSAESAATWRVRLCAAAACCCVQPLARVGHHGASLGRAMSPAFAKPATGIVVAQVNLPAWQMFANAGPPGRAVAATSENVRYPTMRILGGPSILWTGKRKAAGLRLSASEPRWRGGRAIAM